MDKLTNANSSQTILEKTGLEGKNRTSLKEKLIYVFNDQIFRSFLFVFLIAILFFASLYIAYLKSKNEKLEKQLKEALNEIPKAKVIIPKNTPSTYYKEEAAANTNFLQNKMENN
ncbi:MAG: hypothetical protein N2558_02040 [Patescibacteria group bacterium]|nr:hypothetical protein [Patescibacteria group bacterium]